MTELSRRAAWAVAIIATLTMTVSYIDRATFGVLAPSVTEALNISEKEYGWLQSAFAFAYLIATPFAGWWIDRAGARRGLVASVLVWSVIAGLHAIVPTFGVLFALRIALGFAEGPSFPGSAQTVQRVLPAGERERGFGVLFTGSSVGGMLVPPLAAFLFGIAGWRGAFLGTAVIGLVWVPLWIAITGQVAVRARLDAPREVISAPRPRLIDLVRHPLMLRALVAIVAVAPIVGFLQAWGAKYLVREFHLGQKDVGAYLWLPPLAFDVGAIAFGYFSSRQRRGEGVPPRLLFALALAMVASFALLPLAATPWTGIAVITLAMCGGGAIYTLVTADLLARVPPSSIAFAGGILAGAQSLSHIVAGPLVGGSVASTSSFDTVAVTLGVWALPGAIAWLLWWPTRY